MLVKINSLIDFFQEARLCFGKNQFMEYHRLGGSETLRTRLLISQRKFNKYIFYVYILFYTNIFCINIYFSNGIYIFYIFIYIFLCKKKFSVKNFNVKLFFHIKTFFSENNVYFVKNIFFPQIFFFSKKKICQFCNKRTAMVLQNVFSKEAFLHWSKSSTKVFISIADLTKYLNRS